MRYAFIVLWMLSWPVSSAVAQVSVGIGLPGVSIGINLPVYPELVPVPDYPVYYAPQLNSNYFFYDGMYWVYQDDNWYASSWYNGPWGLVAPDVVPLYVLRVPVGYYRQPPAYFHGWASNAPPRWGEHWGNDWERHRRGWDRWDRRSAPRPAPLPVYQRQYSGDRYPPVEQQRALHGQKYRYQPHDPVVRQHYQELQRAPAPSRQEQEGAPQEGSPTQQDIQHANPPPSVQPHAPPAPRAQPPRGGEDVQRSGPPKPSPHDRGPAVQHQMQERQPQPHAQQGEGQRGQHAPKADHKATPQGGGARQQPSGGQGQKEGHEKGQERGQEGRR